jgi:AraC-like DNA-binding protein
MQGKDMGWLNMKARKLNVDSTQRVLPEHDNHDFPFSISEQPVSECDYGNVPHWHNEAQFSLVTCGRVLFRTEDGTYLLNQGEGIFVNSNLLHEAKPVDGDNGSTYLCIKFMPNLIYGQIGSRIYTKYFEKLLYSGQLQVVPFRDAYWEQSLCQSLGRMAKVFGQESPGYELQISSILMECWQLMFANVNTERPELVNISSSDRQRIDALYHYIHNNYSEKITLEDIAAAAHISRGECCRIFKRLHRTTPFQYLIQFRLLQSTRLLAETNYTISEIAQLVGFGSSSYYTECFKREMHCAPYRYRQKLTTVSNTASMIKYTM